VVGLFAAGNVDRPSTGDMPQGITAGAGAVHVVWSDTRTGKLDLYAAIVRP
jgi:hypothetical protein